MTDVRVALFVEGGAETPPAGRKAPLERIWNEHLPTALALPRFELVVPISKKHLVAMELNQSGSGLTMSGNAEGLDQLLVRQLARQPFDAAVVAWDLVPDWNSEGTYCRWAETLRFYELLAQSACLPEPWKTKARERFHELSQRARPGDRRKPPRCEADAILALCMEPVFEALLVQGEAAVRRALGVTHQQLKGWPRHWKNPAELRPDSQVLGPAIESLFRLSPKPPIVKQVGKNWRTGKNDWGELVLRKLLEDDEARALVLSHPITKRLTELLQREPR